MRRAFNLGPAKGSLRLLAEDLLGLPLDTWSLLLFLGEEGGGAEQSSNGQINVNGFFNRRILSVRWLFRRTCA